MSKNEPKKTIRLSEHLVDELKKISKLRGASIESIINVALINVKPRKKILDLKDRMNFGKYSHLTVEEVIRCDQNYASWMIEKADHVNFSSEVEELFYDLQSDLR